MSKKELDQLLDSSYDGIEEYDNDLPTWWVNLFYLTIIFGIAYVAYVHFMGMPTDHERLASELAELDKKKIAANAGGTELSEEQLLQKVSDSTLVQKGHEVFIAKCAMCHGQKAEGLVGPNLTDEYWLHGNKLGQIKNVIEKGVLDKGMLAWKGVVSDDNIFELIAFINSVKNTNVPGKPPQGDKM